MAALGPVRSFIRTYLEPENRLAEVLCGLVMVMSFTTAVHAASADLSSADLLWAVLGCNTAWGIVDGITYILSNITLRSRPARWSQAAQRLGADEARRLITAELHPVLGDLVEPDCRDRLYGQIVEEVQRQRTSSPRVVKEDLYTALACFLIVFLCTLPVAVPFLLLGDRWLASRISNALASLLLFLVGFRWAGFVGLSQWRSGLLFMLGGLMLTGLTVLLGG